MTTINDVKLIHFPKIHDIRGNLSFVEENNQIPFEIKRTFWIYDVPGDAVRGGHAKRKLNEVIISLTGSFDIMIDDGTNKLKYTMNRSYYGLYVPNLIWRELSNFSTNSVALFLASNDYDATDYVYHYDEFLRMKGAE